LNPSGVAERLQTSLSVVFFLLLNNRITPTPGGYHEQARSDGLWVRVIPKGSQQRMDYELIMVLFLFIMP
jgi:hypothetical protein